MIRAAIAFAMALLLAGCDVWVGPKFYTQHEAVNPFRPGTYRVLGDDKPHTIRWDGHDLYENGHRLPKDKSPDGDSLTVPFQTAGRRVFILQTASHDGAIYGFIEQWGDHYVVAWPSCHHALLIAREAGATIHSDIATPVEPIDELLTPEPARKKRGRRPAPRLLEPEAAEDHGNCEFPDRASFEMAARRYIRERQLMGITVDRIPDQAKAERRH